MLLSTLPNMSVQVSTHTPLPWAWPTSSAVQQAGRDAHHTLVALALAEGGFVEPIGSLLHGVGGDLAQGMHNVLLLVPCLWILQDDRPYPIMQ